MENEKNPILEIKDLRVTYETDIEYQLSNRKGKNTRSRRRDRRWQDDNSAEYSSPFAGNDRSY